MYRKKKNMIKLSYEREHQSEQAEGEEELPAWCSLQPSPVPSSCLAPSNIEMCKWQKENNKQC